MARSVALPAEKGSWSLVSEPILLGLLVAPSWAGAALAVGAFALFLCNRPLKVTLADRRRGRSYERTALAWRYLAIYGGVALAGLAGGLALAGWRPFAPLLAAAPLLALFMVYDQRPGRFWQAELVAPVAFAAIVSAMALADGWAWLPALGLWGFMIARAVPAVLFIRSRLRLDKGRPAAPGESFAAVMLAHGLAIAGVVVLTWLGRLPWPAVVAAVMLLARAVWGLSPWRWRSSVVALGFLETGFGILAVVLVAVGYWVG
jgi:hypothetical protein